MTGTFQFNFLNPLVDTEGDVLAIRAKALAIYTEGKTILEWEGEGSSTVKDFVAPIESILAECNRALKLINPAKYGSVVRQSTMLRIG